MYLKDANFLKALDEDRNKIYHVHITVLDNLNKAIKTIEGEVLPGSSITIDGTSNMRRTCNITFIATKEENDLTDINNLLSINKKIKIVIGIEKKIDFSKDIYYFKNKDYTYNEDEPENGGFPPTGEKGKIYVDRTTLKSYKWDADYQELKSMYDYKYDIAWFPLGVFVINQPNLSHAPNGCTISLSCKDKMCLLNGELGGNLPTSVTFHEYDQIIGVVESDTPPLKPNKEKNPLQTIDQNDYTIYKCYTDSSKTEYSYQTQTEQYGQEESDQEAIFQENGGHGLRRSDGIPAGGVISKPQLIFDIIQTLVIYYGGEAASNVIINDVPKELKQLVRQTGDTTLYFDTENGYYTTDEREISSQEDIGKRQRTFEYNEDVGYEYTDFTYPGSLVSNIGDNVCSVLDTIKNTLGNFEYFYDIDGNFVFQEIKNYLNNSYNPTEDDSGRLITYYLDDCTGTAAIQSNSLQVIGRDNYKADYVADQGSIYNFTEGNNLIMSSTNAPSFVNLKNDYHIQGKNKDGYAIHYHLAIKERPSVFETRKVIFLKKKDGEEYNGQIRLPIDDNEEGAVDYTPDDQRAELYLQGLEIAKAGARPDIYQQELLNFFDGIYEQGYYDDNKKQVPHGRFKGDVYEPNNLNYFLDYLEPVDRLYGVTVDDIGPKIYTCEQDKVVRIYNKEVPNYLIVDEAMDEDYKRSIQEKCDEEGQPYSTVPTSLYSKVIIGTIGYAAQEVARDLLYQYSSYNEAISFQCIPIYYLDANKRITIRDRKAGINGDYVIKNITLPLVPNSSMSISATKALERI